VTKSHWIQTDYTAGFCIPLFALIVEQIAKHHKSKSPFEWRTTLMHMLA